MRSPTAQCLLQGNASAVSDGRRDLFQVGVVGFLNRERPFVNNIQARDAMYHCLAQRELVSTFAQGA